MSARFIPNEIRDQIRDNSDIVDVIGSYIQLKQLGHAWKACCPFHNEKTPSFTVSAERQSFHCFGCGKGGDVFRFVMEHEGVDFTTAAHLLAQRAHIHIPENNYGNAESGQAADRKDRLYEIHEQLTSWYQSFLKTVTDSSVAQYLATRSLDADSIAKFRLGAAPDGWDGAVNFLKKQGFTDEEIKLSGVVSESEKSAGRFYDRFRNRLIFPIWNEQGRVVGFSSRKVVESDGGGKYINSPESPIFKKSKVLYAFSFARRAMQSHREGAILCEGQLDVIAMHRAGFDNTVAPQGTAFTPEQAAMIRRQTDRLAIALDSDSAGTEATLRAIETALPLGFEIRVIRFPGGKDPDDLYKNQGMESIHEAVHQSVDFLDFLLTHYAQLYDLSTAAGRAKVGNEVIRYLAKIENEIRLAAYVTVLVAKLKIPENAVMTELYQLRGKEDRTNVKKEIPVPVEPTLTIEIETVEMRRARIAEEEILRLILEYEPAAQTVAAQVSHEVLSTSPVALAIEEVIQKTLNGEWFERDHAVQEIIYQYPDAGLSRYLVESHLTYNDAMREKAVRDSISVLLECSLKTRLDAAMAAWKNAGTETETLSARNLYYELDRELKLVKKSRMTPR